METRLRQTIDRTVAAACAACPSPCCRVHYCRETARNPWYRLVNETAGTFILPADWASRRDPFGLGLAGCELRAGRYCFCYSYNCPRLLATLPQSRRAAFQELSDRMLAVNRIPGGRFLHELRDPDSLGPPDLAAVDWAVAESSRDLDELARFVEGDPTPALRAGQAHQGGNP